MTTQQSFKSDAFIRHPLFLKDVQKQTETLGLAAALARKLKQINVHIRINGDLSLWSKPGKSCLLIGDHSKGLEPILVLAVFGMIGREDIKVTAKPYALSGQLYTALAGYNNSYQIDFIPSVMARGRRDGSFWDKIFRMLYAKDLLTKNEIRLFNKQSLQAASQSLEEGYGVNIYPTGEVSSTITQPWRLGIGQMIEQLSPVAKNNTFVVPYVFTNIHPWSVVKALVLSHFGIQPKRQEVVFHIGDVVSLSEIFGSIENAKITAETITATLRQRFRDEFHSFV